MEKVKSIGIIVRESVIDHAENRLLYWEDRLRTACKATVGKKEFDGGFRNLNEKERHW